MESDKYFDLNRDFYKTKFEKSLDYKAYMNSSKDTERARWQSVYDLVVLTDPQKKLLGSFSRKMNVLCMSGAWCGDCVKQGPIFQRITEASSVIDLRFLDRDSNPDLRDRLRILGGTRVPVVIFLSEDFFECGKYGDRTLSTYRRMAVERIGPACSTGIVPPAEEELAAVTQDWVDIFERIQLMLRLAPMLRERYGD
ncbi:thiol reductase thioredoxin [Candidatus Poribacteria bacterium]|nr:thiol reductase thioredoxin [Candidatus Poribacteria bacterium]